MAWNSKQLDLELVTKKGETKVSVKPFLEPLGQTIRSMKDQEINQVKKKFQKKPDSPQPHPVVPVGIS